MTTMCMQQSPMVYQCEETSVLSKCTDGLRISPLNNHLSHSYYSSGIVTLDKSAIVGYSPAILSKTLQPAGQTSALSRQV